MEAPTVACTLDLGVTGAMKDIVSNALLRGVGASESAVTRFLQGAERRYADGQTLLAAAAAQFELSRVELAAEVERYRHCNCSHAGGGAHAERDDQAEGAGTAPPPPPSQEQLTFARDVALSVVLHELGHALIREFDLPVLDNEETAADAFATHYLTRWLPERAPDVLSARVTSLLSEAADVPRVEWAVGGEHGSDARRAHQIAALAVAADGQAFAELAALVEMSERDMRKSSDYGAEIHRSWRRTLAPLWMPEGRDSNEVRVVSEWDDALGSQLVDDTLLAEVRTALQRFDWHSQVTVRFVDSDGGAGWSRSKRTVTVTSEYLRRFVEQARRVGG